MYCNIETYNSGLKVSDGICIVDVYGLQKHQVAYVSSTHLRDKKCFNKSQTHTIYIKPVGT